MTSLRCSSWATLLLAFSACGGGTGSGDSGSADTGVIGMDAPVADAPAAGQDASLLDDAPPSRLDAFALDDATRATDDAHLEPDAAPPGRVDAFVSGAFCGGIAGFPCRDARQYCDESCTTPDAGGVCRDRPERCTDEVAPVCGCDGTTYSNACMAAMAGVSVRASGACPMSDCRESGCERGLECCTGGRSAGRCYDPRCLSCCM